jgi:hypothetical protein
MKDGQRSGRPALAVVTSVETAPVQSLSFCSHCGAKPASSDIEEARSRVCDQCGLGLLLQASRDAAPNHGDAFIVLDSSLSVCAVSQAAEMLLAIRETEAVNRHLTELLVPADTEAQGSSNLAVAVTWAARGDSGTRTVTVRPTNTFGIRLTARIASCGPPKAALLVFDAR